MPVLLLLFAEGEVEGFRDEDEEELLLANSLRFKLLEEPKPTEKEEPDNEITRFLVTRYPHSCVTAEVLVEETEDGWRGSLVVKLDAKFRNV